MTSVYHAARLIDVNIPEQDGPTVQYDILTREPNIAAWMIRGGNAHERDLTHRSALATGRRFGRPALRARLAAALRAFKAGPASRQPVADCCPA